jgi:hypothetical protein
VDVTAVVGLAIVGVVTVAVDGTRSASSGSGTHLTEQDGRTGRTGAERDADGVRARLERLRALTRPAFSR